jgi:ribose transport system permease protein
MSEQPPNALATEKAPPVAEQARVEAAAEQAGEAGWTSTLARIGEVRNLGLVGVLAVLGIVGVITADTFWTQSNILTILQQASVVGVLSVGMTFVIIGGGIDLSVGKAMALASVWCTTVSTQSYGPVVMVLCALAVGMAVGLVNGVLIAYGRVVPFIATLAMLASAQGLAEWISNKQSQLVTQESINKLATTKPLGVPLLVWMFAVVAVLGWILLNRTTFGRRTFAVGGNIEAARLAGINVRRHTTLLYVLSGVCVGIAAIMITSLTTTGSSTHGNLYELDAIAAVIIGGTALTGGRGTVVGSVIGVVIFTTISNLFILNNLETETQNIAKGVIIVIAVLLQRRGRESPV